MVTMERQELISAEQFFEIAALPENEDKRLELEEGMIVEMAGSKPINTVTAARLVYFINAVVIPNDLGCVTGADGIFQLDAHTARIPDVAFVSKTRLAEGIPPRFTFAPDLAVELVSPDEDVFRKAREYLRAGAKAVWAVYTEDKIISVFSAVSETEFRVKEYGIDDTLTAPDILPGFALPVRDIFPA